MLQSSAILHETYRERIRHFIACWVMQKLQKLESYLNIFSFSFHKCLDIYSLITKT